MRLTDEVMRASDQCFIDFAKNAFVLASSGRFGLLPSVAPFEISLDISNGLVDVISLNCTAITSGGDLIEAHYDTKYNNSFDTRIQIPVENDVAEYILTINAEGDKWSDTNNGYEEQAYAFKLIPINSPIGDNALPKAHIVDAQDVVDALTQENAVLLGVDCGYLCRPAHRDVQPVSFLCRSRVLRLLGTLAAGDGGCPAGEEVRPCSLVIAVLIHHGFILLNGNADAQPSDIHHTTPSRMANSSERNVSVRA